jgi:ubiquinone/menaquinone biosynthesis C-methylase UbiE
MASSDPPSDAGAAPVVFDRVAESYDETRGFPPGVEDAVAELIAAAGGLGPASRALELGIGTGRIALPLAARVGSVIGVDLSAPMLAVLAAKRGARPVRAALADAARLPFPGASFDAVIGVHVFHLIPRWREVLAETARVLRPGARLLVAADDASGADLWAQWRRRLWNELGIENAGVPRRRFEDFPAVEGWTRVEPVHRIAFERRLPPQALLDRMAKRSWSQTWKMRDDDLARLVDELRAELVARYGSLDEPVAVQSGFWVRAWLPRR